MMRTSLAICAFLAGAVAIVCGAEAPEPVLAFLAPPQHVGPPLARHAPTNRRFQGISSMAVSPGGRLWVTWYASEFGGEDHGNYVVLATSGDNGRIWKEVLTIDPDGDGGVRAFDPEIWMAPDGKLRLFWAQAFGMDGAVSGVWIMETAEPEAENPKWGPPVRVTDGIMMCKPLVLSTGEWVLPVSTWGREFSSKMVVSEDRGRTWTIRGAANVPRGDRQFDEHMFIERKDGSLWLLVRTRYGIGESISTDRGRNWPEVTPSAIPQPLNHATRFFTTRLASGNLLHVTHDPAITITTMAERSRIMAYVSTDDGKTWGGGLLLDDRRFVTYPDGQQAADGTIYITYDRERHGAKEILFAAFREEDAAAGTPVSDAVRLRQLVSKATFVGEAPRRPVAVNANSDGVPLVKTPAGALAGEGFESAAFELGALVFTDRRYTIDEMPDVLKGAHFLRMPIFGKKTLRCVRAGMVYLLTPAPENNIDSQSKSLIDQGFEKVQLPETRLFEIRNQRNFCTLYQKSCAEGDTITIDGWAVPLFWP